MNKNERNIDRKILKRRALQKPEVENPETKLSANRIIIAFITNKNKPKVTTVAGSVKKISKGFTNMFNNDITIAKIKAAKKPEIKTPGNI